eukprot:ANDGO_03078.mRNA.1 Pre-mRNA-processing factor 19 homolog 1
MYCALCGQIPQEPVVSKKTGHLFERRLIEKYIAEHGKCPITSTPLTLDDLLPIATAPIRLPASSGLTSSFTTFASSTGSSASTTNANFIAARSPNHPAAQQTSVPSLLQLLQSEWDSLAIESFALRQTLEMTRQELAHALYQHDAACRVIARLISNPNSQESASVEQMTDVDSQPAAEHTAANSNARAESGNGNGNGSALVVGMHVPSLGEDQIETLVSHGKTLAAERKARGAAPVYTVASFAHVVVRSPSLTPASQSASQEICLFSNSAVFSEYVVAGKGSMVLLLSKNCSSVVQTVSTRSVVSGVALNGSFVVAVSGVDGSISQFALKNTSHDGDLAFTGTSTHAQYPYAESALAAYMRCDVHPSGAWYGVCAGSEKSWTLMDAASGKPVARFVDVVSSAEVGYSAFGFHPDGLLAACGLGNAVRIWDIKASSVPAFFDTQRSSVASLRFSENGYYLAVGTSDGYAQLWDLRKLKMVKEWDLQTATTVAVNFDASGSVMAFGSASTVKIVSAGKGLADLAQWTLPSVCANELDYISSVAFGGDSATNIIVGRISGEVVLLQ